jgi:hypothetical protein
MSTHYNMLGCWDAASRHITMHVYEIRSLFQNDGHPLTQAYQELSPTRPGYICMSANSALLTKGTTPIKHNGRYRRTNVLDNTTGND